MRRAGTGACPYDAKVSVRIRGWQQYVLSIVNSMYCRLSTVCTVDCQQYVLSIVKNMYCWLAANRRAATSLCRLCQLDSNKRGLNEIGVLTEASLPIQQART